MNNICIDGLIVMTLCLEQATWSVNGLLQNIEDIYLRIKHDYICYTQLIGN